MLTVEPGLQQEGLSVAVVVARGVDNSRTPPALIAYRRKVGRELADHWKNRSLSSHPVFQEYERLHRNFGVLDEPAAPEKLLRTVRRNMDLAASSAAVDCYNLVSIKTLLSIGAHDCARFESPVALRRTSAADTFVPLGETTPREVVGEYAYVEPQGRVICRLEVLQAEHSKVDVASRDIAFFLQGNAAQEGSQLLKGCWFLAELIETFCGGSAELVTYLDARRENP